MDDLISRQSAIDLLKNWSGGYDYIETETEAAIKDFQDLPPIDAVPVIRCKECKHLFKVKNGIFVIYWCERDWCCYVKREEK